MHKQAMHNHSMQCIILLMSPFFIGYFNLMKSVLGSGLITYPYLFTVNGVVPTIILTLVSAFFSAQGLFIYLKLNNNKNKTMSTLTKNKQFKIFVNAIIVTKCVSVTLSYVVMIREIFGSISATYGLPYFNVFFVCFAIATMPVSTFKQFKKLRFTSFLGITATCTMVIATLSRFIYTEPTGQLCFFKKINYRTLGNFVYTFTCHQNIFTFQNECIMPLSHCYGVILCTTFSCIALYFVFGMSNAYLFSITNKFFESVPSSMTTLLMQGCFLVMIIFSIPLQLTAAQSYLDIKKMKYRWLFVSAAYTISIIIALLGVNFNTVLSLIGGTVSSFMCFIIAGLYYFMLGGKQNKLWLFNAAITLGFGVLMVLMTVYNVLLSIIDRK